MPSTYTRRGVLGALAGLTAGCVADDPDSPANTATRTATRSTTTSRTPTKTPTDEPTSEPTDAEPSSHYHQITLEAAETDPTGVAAGWSRALETLPPEARTVAAAALGGETEVEEWRGPPLEAGAYLVDDGRYYRVEESVVGERTVTTYRFEAEVPARSEPPGDPLAYGDLTPEERRVVDGAAEDWEPGDSGYARAYPVVFEAGDPADCRFLDGDTYYVEYEGTTVSLYHDDEGTATMLTYRYACPEVAASESAFADVVVSERVADVSAADLPESELAVARELFEDGYFESENPATQGALGFAYWLYDYQSPVSGVSYVRWEGTLYSVRVSEAVS